MLYQLSYTPRPAALPLLKTPEPRKWHPGNPAEPDCALRALRIRLPRRGLAAPRDKQGES
ncbi:MAG: hypothetical protein JWQ89_1372 [Devosia sp.]|nr:hypothetical protein [Devosia sp.]